MKFEAFSAKQLQAMNWWMPQSRYSRWDALICDGAVRSGKTLCMGIGFAMWACAVFEERSFAFCGKTIRSLRRNLITTLLPALQEIGFSCKAKLSENLVELSLDGRMNRFYLFGGRDEGAAALIQGITLAGVFFDEVALMPRSFVAQALARCSVQGSKFWFNCNPEHPQHWFYREWILNAAQKHALYLHFTMEDNPSLSPEIRARYRGLYSGTFYERFVEGKWVAAQGLVYPFMAEQRFCAVPQRCEEYRVSCDYGTVNPASFGLWGKKDGIWYRVDEYYFDSRAVGEQRTDEEHYQALQTLCTGKTVTQITVDPSAASFLETIHRHGEFTAIPAENNVLEGIRKVGVALKEGKIRVCSNCTATVREFGLYRWKDSGGQDAPVKEHDHAMDDIRYFVTTLLEEDEPFFVAACTRG